MGCIECFKEKIFVVVKAITPCFRTLILLLVPSERALVTPFWKQAKTLSAQRRRRRPVFGRVGWHLHGNARSIASMGAVNSDGDE
jgi:hypothetical protein